MLKGSRIVPYIPVADVARARKFYEDKTGLTPKETCAGGVILRVRQRLVGLHVSHAGRRHPSKASTAFWTVDDVEAKVAELRARGVTFEECDMPGLKTVNGVATASGAKTAWFKDSEGNILAISQRL